MSEINRETLTLNPEEARAVVYGDSSDFEIVLTTRENSSRWYFLKDG